MRVDVIRVSVHARLCAHVSITWAFFFTWRPISVSVGCPAMIPTSSPLLSATWRVRRCPTLTLGTADLALARAAFTTGGCDAGGGGGGATDHLHYSGCG